MSEMGFTSDEERLEACGSCAMVVLKRAVIGAYTGSVLSWQTPQHLAPCGRQCFGAGARGKHIREWRAGEFHTAGKCKDCTP